MKLRIPRRIKVEEESSDSESESAPEENTEAQEPVKDKVPVVTTKSLTVSTISM